MKKILTLFVMLLCGWSIVSAQAPVFGYQAVVRTTADSELVANATVDVAIQVMDENQQELYSETQTGKHTDNLGMLSILVGSAATNPDTLKNIDWKNATTIRATITVNGNQIVINSPVCAVPYALQAGSSKLTTEQIVDYLSDEQTDITDFEEIMDSLLANVPSNGQLWQQILDRLAQYLKDHKEKAVEVGSHYLSQIDSDDVVALYNEVVVKTDVVEAIVAKAKERALASKDYAVEVLEAYLSQLTQGEVDEFVTALKTNEAKFYPYVKNFAINHRDFALSMARYYLANANTTQVDGALSEFNKPDCQMKHQLVDVLFYNYLDSYLVNRITSSGISLTDQEIEQQVKDKLDPEYLQKTECGGTQVDICPIWNAIENQ